MGQWKLREIAICRAFSWWTPHLQNSEFSTHWSFTTTVGSTTRAFHLKMIGIANTFTMTSFFYVIFEIYIYISILREFLSSWHTFCTYVEMADFPPCVCSHFFVQMSHINTQENIVWRILLWKARFLLAFASTTRWLWTRMVSSVTNKIVSKFKTKMRSFTMTLFCFFS